MLQTFNKKISLALNLDSSYVLKNGKWIVLGSAISFSGTFLTSIAFANLLDPDLYGQYKFIFSVVGLIGALSLTGSAAVITRSVAKGFEGTFKKQVLLQFKTSFLALIVGAGVGMYYLFQDNLFLGFGIIVAAIGAPLLRGLTLHASFYEGKKLFGKIVSNQLTHTMIPAFCVVSALFYTDNIIWLIAAYFTSHILINALLTQLTLHNHVENQSVDKEAKRYSMHLSIQGLIAPVANHLDKILVFQYIGATELAIYAVATALPTQMNVVRKGIRMLVYPKLSQQKLEHIKRNSTVKIFLLFLAGLALYGTYYVLAPYIFMYLFPVYIDAVDLSRLIAVGIILLPAMYYNLVMYAQKMTKQLYVTKTSIPAIKILLLLILTPTYGIYGVVVGLLISSVIEFILQLYLVHSYKTVKI